MKTTKLISFKNNGKEIYSVSMPVKEFIYVLESRCPAKGYIKWLPIPSFSSLNGSEYVFEVSKFMREKFPDHQFRVVTYSRDS